MAKWIKRLFNELRVVLGRALRLSLESHARKLFTLVCGLGAMIVAPAVTAQKLPAPPPNGRKAPTVAKPILTALASAPSLQEQEPQQAPPPTSSKQAPPG